MAIKIRISDEDFRLVAARFSPEEKANAMDLLLFVLVGETPEVAPISERVGDWWYQISDKLTKERDSYITFCSKAKTMAERADNSKTRGRGGFLLRQKKKRRLPKRKRQRKKPSKRRPQRNLCRQPSKSA